MPLPRTFNIYDLAKQLVNEGAPPVLATLREECMTAGKLQQAWRDVREIAICLGGGPTQETKWYKEFVLTDDEWAEYNREQQVAHEERAANITRITTAQINEMFTMATAWLRGPATRWEVAVAIAIWTGRRLSEIFVKGKFRVVGDRLFFSGQLKKKDKDWPEYEIPTLCPDLGALMDRITSLQYYFTDNKYVDSYASKETKKVVERFGVPGISFHALRKVYIHTTFTGFQRHEYSVNHWAQLVSGHTYMITSVHYTDMAIEPFDDRWMKHNDGYRIATPDNV